MRSTDSAAREILFLASPMVSATDAASQAAIDRAKRVQIECESCFGTFPAAEFDGNTCCPPCFDAAGMENEHSDGWHEDFVTGCELCQKEAMGS